MQYAHVESLTITRDIFGVIILVMDSLRVRVHILGEAHAQLIHISGWLDAVHYNREPVDIRRCPSIQVALSNHKCLQALSTLGSSLFDDTLHHLPWNAIAGNKGSVLGSA